MTEQSGTSKLDRTAFNRDFFGSHEDFTVIGSGEIGGKAQGLALIKDNLQEGFGDSTDTSITVNIPRLTVIRTKVFDKFMKRNKLYDIAMSDSSDEIIAMAFQKGDFPVEFVGDVMGLINKVKTPLAIRSSSMLEDAMYRPFAGVYATKMIPNNQLEPQKRFQKLIEAIKYVWASTFFKESKAYISRIGKSSEDEKMAVIIQEVVGLRYKDRFYPTISGVGRSFNYYPTGHAKQDQGVVDLALGLGKTIVDGGVVWSYSPSFPKANPPYNTINELLDVCQRTFWSVNMGKPPEYDPINEAEYMVKAEVESAQEDDTLRLVASTYNGASDRLTPGTGVDGPRLINFAMILVHNQIRLNNVIKKMLEICEEKTGGEVEIEFAVTIDPKKSSQARIGFLQVRPMVVSNEKIEISDEMMHSSDKIASSERVMGNGAIDTIRDIVYVRPESFEAKFTPQIATEVEEINKTLVREDIPYLLTGFGRWGSSEPWLGIPVNWSQISGAKVIIEATLPEMNVDLSQGSHFFHNLSSFKISYFSIHHEGKHKIDWEWLNAQKALSETDHVRHVRLEKPLNIRVDGQTGRGIITHG